MMLGATCLEGGGFEPIDKPLGCCCCCCGGGGVGGGGGSGYRDVLKEGDEKAW